MRTHSLFWASIFQYGVPRWLTAACMCVLLGANVVPSSAQPVVLQEPDFSGMFIIPAFGTLPVLRDSTRGWTYFSGSSTYFTSGNVEGVAFSQWLFRINDAGLPDTQWRLPSDFQITEQYLAADGTPIVQAYVKNSPTYEKRWYSLARDGVGFITPAEISNVINLPPRDSIDLTQNTGLGERRLPQRDGTNVTVETAFSASPPPNGSYIVTLNKRDNRNNVLWAMPISGRAHNLATDAQGNAYVLGEAVSIGGKTANLLRIRSDGSVDAAWNPDINIASNVSSIVRVINDRIVIADAIGGATTIYRLTTLDRTTGNKLTERYPSRGFSGITDDGAVLSAQADGRWALLDSSRNDASGDRVSVARVGTSTQATTSVRWKDGYVIGGDFLFWFDGKLYRNLMRVDASFRPDPTWTPAVDATVTAMTVDAQNRLIVASTSTSAQQRNLIRFNADGTLDTAWQPIVTGNVYKLLPTSDGLLFVGGAFSAINGLARGSLARFSADGALDPDWASQPSWPVLSAVTGGQFGRDGIYSILDAGADGIVFTWEDGYSNGSDAGVVRLSRDASGAPLSVPRGAGFGMRDPATGVIYGVGDAWDLTRGTTRGTVLIRLVPPNMTVDTGWTTFAGDYGRQFAGFAYQSNEHIYVCRGQNVWLGTEIRRFDKVTGKEDPDWRSNESYLCNANFFERGADGTTTALLSYAGPPLRFSNTARNEPRAVVEYYSRDAKRFFITGRTNEITLLDAQPASFTRTGMQFGAQSALVQSSDTATTPVCRFYASPATGGSNTHFYGRDGDCSLLKRFSTFRYEGYDFRAGMPDSSGTCPQALPQPVYRLFNQQTADNNGNHRYVVSDATKHQMVTAGWVAEGIAFCTASATDSRPLADVTQ